MAIQQPSLFDELNLSDVTEPANGAGSDGIAEQFRRFHEANPHVYDNIVKLALRLQAQGRKGYGMKGLFEVLRWHHAMSTVSEGDSFKLNNNYTAFYAREVMANEPRLAGFFALREQRILS